MTSPGAMAASATFSTNREGVDKLAPFDFENDFEDWLHNYCFAKRCSNPSSEFLGADDFLFKELIEKHQVSIKIDHQELKDDDDDIEAWQMRNILARYIYTLPHAWSVFQLINDPDLLQHAIRLVASLFLLVTPQDIICPSSRSLKRVTQLNHLWENLKVLLTTPPPRQVEEAFLLIIQHLTTDPQQYSLLTETDVSDMINCFCLFPQLNSTDPHTSYKYIINTPKEETPLFETILGVLDKVDVPPKLKLEVGEHTRLLMMILNNEPVVEQLLKKLDVDELLPNCYNGSSHHYAKPAYINLVKRIIIIVKLKIMDHLSSLQTLFRNLWCTSYDCMSPEVISLVNVAEVRRIALGSRFISRSHLLWAFFELGYVLPPQIKVMIKTDFTSVCDDHPPYHIYLLSKKLADHYSEVMQLKTFIFSVIYYGADTISEAEGEMESIVLLYERFLIDLTSSGSKRYTQNLIDAK